MKVIEKMDSSIKIGRGPGTIHTKIKRCHLYTAIAKEVALEDLGF